MIANLGSHIQPRTVTLHQQSCCGPPLGIKAGCRERYNEQPVYLNYCTKGPAQIRSLWLAKCRFGTDIQVRGSQICRAQSYSLYAVLTEKGWGRYPGTDHLSLQQVTDDQWSPSVLSSLEFSVTKHYLAPLPKVQSFPFCYHPVYSYWLPPTCLIFLLCLCKTHSQKYQRPFTQKTQPRSWTNDPFSSAGWLVSEFCSLNALFVLSIQNRLNLSAGWLQQLQQLLVSILLASKSKFPRKENLIGPAWVMCPSLGPTWYRTAMMATIGSPLGHIWKR